jgi:hypothetical protein
VGAAAQALLIVMLAGSAHADPCTGKTDSGSRFATCFDPGNRFSLTAATDGFGGSLALRHELHFDDEPDLVWKLEHDLVDAEWSLDNSVRGLVYRGRYLRHARDGHIVLPLGSEPQKIYLPFDIGAMVEVGNIVERPGKPVELGIIKTAALIDISRSRDFRRRLAFGPVATWDVELMRSPVAVDDHRVTPFSALLVELHLESQDGLTLFDLRGEAGTSWHTSIGWHRRAQAEALLERVVIAVNDRPVALFLSGRYDSSLDEAVAALGLRIVLVDRTDPRVSKL